MYPRLFFEKFGNGNRENILFVCMPFGSEDDPENKGLLDKKYDTIQAAAKSAGFSDARRVDRSKTSNSLESKICEGIAQSRMVLIDISDCPRFAGLQRTKRLQLANNNVMYELGLAVAIRKPEDILIIKDRGSSATPFDIDHLPREHYDGKIEKDWLVGLLVDAKTNQQFLQDKLVESTADSLDAGSILLINKFFGQNAENNFGISQEFRIEFRHQLGLGEVDQCIFRLLELGLLYTTTLYRVDRVAVTKKEQKNILAEETMIMKYSYSYRWTEFGSQVARYIKARTQMK